MESESRRVWPEGRLFWLSWLGAEGQLVGEIALREHGAMEVAAESRGKILVGKELMSEPPATRDSLASWRIYATIPIGRGVDPLQRAWEERFGRSTIYPQLRLQGEP